LSLMLFWKRLKLSHIICNCRHVPRYIMCFMLFSTRSLKAPRQLNMHRCHQMLRGRTVAQPDSVGRARPTESSWELLIRWQGCSMVEATWEPLEQFKEDYPDVMLEDELFHWGGVFVDSSGRQYVRRNKRSTTRVS
jgi:hypothetical protein